MMSLPDLSEGLIRESASAESFRRGQEYYESGAVFSLVRRGDIIEAEVEGSQPEPYSVRIEFNEDGTIDAGCNCPFDWGGWCKHIVATLLACLHDPESVTERPPLEQSLAELDREQLQRLVLALAAREPRLGLIVEAQITLLATAAPSPLPATSSSPTPMLTGATHLDPAPFRRQVRASLRSLSHMRPSEAYWYVGEALAGVNEVLEQAWTFVRLGDGRAGLVVLEAVIEEYLAGYENLDDSNGEVSGFGWELGPAWAEALLSANLTAEERQGWVEKLEAWQAELGDYGLDEVLDPALGAAVQGWLHPTLRRLLDGEFPDAAAEEITDEVPAALRDEVLTRARLNVLERQERLEEYLRLARAAGQRAAYTTMLVRLDRVVEATEYGLGHLATTQEALALATALREHGAVESALGVAQRGLSLEGRKAALAKWLRDLAAGIGNTDLALSAALVAFEEEPDLAAYLTAQELAAEGWPEVRGLLLDRVRKVKDYYSQGPVDIFLHEDLIADAIALVDKGATHNLVERVVDAASQSHPDWVIQACRRQAEPIMNEGKAQYYDSAAGWLGKARAAYRASGREEEWQAYLAELLLRHGRKYKLVPLLNRLR